jgi:hypothetical protein
MDFLKVGKYRINISKILYYTIKDSVITISFDTKQAIHDIEISFPNEEEFLEYCEIIDDMLEVEVEDISRNEI